MGGQYFEGTLMKMTHGFPTLRAPVSLLLLCLTLIGICSPSVAADVAAAAARPNLIPRNVALSAYSVRPGDTVTVRWNMTNSGSGSCPASFTGVYIGNSASLPPSNGTPIWTLTTPEIPAGGSVNQAVNIAIPFNQSLGTFYIWVIADDVESSSLNQTTRADDAKASPAFGVANTVIRPNLIPQNVVINATHARPGDQVTVEWTIQNLGNVRCPESITGIHLGTSATTPPATDAMDVAVASPEVPAQASIRQTNTVTIPAGTAFGTYYLWIVLDDTPNSTLNQISRADDAARSGALSVVAVIPRPNLVPSNVRLSASSVRPGDPISIAWTTTNSGTANCPTNITGLHLGTSATTPPTNDGLNLRVATAAIAAGAAVRQTNTVTIPANTALGNYYLWVVSDDMVSSTLNQSSRADDATRSELLEVVNVIRNPNLVPLSMTVGETHARPGDQVTVVWSLTNSGNIFAPASVTGFHLGSSSATKPNNAPIILVDTPQINTNTLLRRTNIVTIPANTALGTHYLWVIADDTNNSALNQSSRADDALASSSISVVSTLPRPNLVPQNIVLSSYFTRPGQQLTLTWSITNSGGANCPASVTGLHLGTSATTPPTSDPLDLSVDTPAINANSSVRQTNNITLPANLAPGTYYLWVVADDVANSTLNQSSRADDAARSAALMVAVVTLTSPASGAVVTAPPTFIWSAAGPVTTRVYLSAKAAPVIGADTFVVFETSGASPFTPNVTNWMTAVNALGVATNYYWAVGSSDAAKREVYSNWVPFRISPVALAPLMVAGSGDFRFQIIAPHLPQVTVEWSDNLTSWTELTTIANSTGTVTYTDQSPESRERRFFRVKP